MSGQGKVPNAWDDDDWTNKADEPVQKEPSPPPRKLTKAERRAKQAEFNRQLWADAEAPPIPYYVEQPYEPPLQTAFKPNVTLLARKPAPTTIVRKDPVTGFEKLTVEDEDGEDEEEKPVVMTMEERKAKAQKELEEKQKRYEEARERLFGPSKSGSSSPRSTTPPAKTVERGRGRGRGYASRDTRETRPGTGQSAAAKQLYDPNYTPKENSVYLQKREERATEPAAESQILRNPRGPDGSGRGGRGFVNRGGSRAR